LRIVYIFLIVYNFNLTMDIFVVSLERSQDRRKTFDNFNSKYIKYKYHNAVDGYLLDIDKLGPDIIRKGTINYSKGAIGCALSHLQLWELCIEMNKPIIILEDDAIVSKDFNKHINNLMNNLAPKNWDIIQLSYNFDSVLSYKNTCYEDCHCIFGKKVVTNADINAFVNSKITTTIARLNNCFGTAAYILTPHAAKLLKSKCFPMDSRMIQVPFLNPINCFSIDSLMNSVYKDLQAYVTIIPFVMTPHISTEYKTTII
jgi:glycosyl transferase, family 25